MEPVRHVVGRALPLARADVDTDQIIPSHWLKRLGRTGYAAGLFEAWRRDPGFVMNDARYDGASILLAGANFGSGASAESLFALSNGYMGIRGTADEGSPGSSPGAYVAGLYDGGAAGQEDLAVIPDWASTEIAVDVEQRLVTAPGLRAPFALDDHARSRLLAGLDDIAVTLLREADITAYEKKRPEWLPKVR